MANQTSSSETKIYYSKSKNATSMILWGIATIILIVTFIISAIERQVFMSNIAVLATVLTSLIVYFKYKDTTNKIPQLIISDEGIQVATDRNGNVTFLLYTWPEIENEKITMSTKTNSYTLNFSHNSGNEKIVLHPLSIKPDDLEKLLRNYRFGLNV